MKEFISLKIDYAFKLIFGKEGNEAILIAFLNAALKLPQESRIEEITIINPELNKEYPEDKKSILDVRAITSQGMQINIEIQILSEFSDNNCYPRKFVIRVDSCKAGNAAVMQISTRIIDYCKNSGITRRCGSRLPSPWSAYGSLSRKYLPTNSKFADA